MDSLAYAFLEEIDILFSYIVLGEEKYFIWYHAAVERIKRNYEF
jgi:hypothetical protein